uniref:Uncharacterized protein n=1 Tax=Anguilla anguilla TaxID=7936 RepID=A0A0E9VYJ8_ANGAN
MFSVELQAEMTSFFVVVINIFSRLYQEIVFNCIVGRNVLQNDLCRNKCVLNIFQMEL